MKNLIVALLVCVLVYSPAKADDLDLLSDEMLIGNNSGDVVENSEPKDDSSQSESFFGFIIKPISNLFGSDSNINEKPQGEEESPLDRSIRLAQEGDLENQMNLAYMYLYGTNGVEQDFSKAFQYYEMASKQEDAIALNNLGSLYFSGIGTKRDTKTAIKLFEAASKLGNDNASLNLAFIYLTGGAKSYERNKKAFSLFEKAQKSGNKIAEFMLGYAYYKGFVVEQDYEQAYKLIKSAANAKSQIDEAQLILAEMYTNGRGTVQNYLSAVKSYRAAVNQGNIEAITTLADIYAEGKITPQNMVLAHALYNIAAAQNVSDAAQKRDNLNEKMQLQQLIEAQETAQNFKAAPSELTKYIRQTYGYNIRNYIDINMPNLMMQ